jgi:hypothetical protein
VNGTLAACLFWRDAGITKAEGGQDKHVLKRDLHGILLRCRKKMNMHAQERPGVQIESRGPSCKSYANGCCRRSYMRLLRRTIDLFRQMRTIEVPGGSSESHTLTALG